MEKLGVGEADHRLLFRKALPNLIEKYLGGDVNAFENVVLEYLLQRKYGNKREEMFRILLISPKDFTAILPSEISGMIFMLLDPQDILHSSLVNRSWHSLLSSPYIWKRLSRQNFRNDCEANLPYLPSSCFNGNPRYNPLFPDWKHRFFRERAIRRLWMSKGHLRCRLHPLFTVTRSRDRKNRLEVNSRYFILVSQEVDAPETTDILLYDRSPPYALVHKYSMWSVNASTVSNGISVGERIIVSVVEIIESADKPPLKRARVESALSDGLTSRNWKKEKIDIHVIPPPSSPVAIEGTAGLSIPVEEIVFSEQPATPRSKKWHEDCDTYLKWKVNSVQIRGEQEQFLVCVLRRLCNNSVETLPPKSQWRLVVWDWERHCAVRDVNDLVAAIEVANCNTLSGKQLSDLYSVTKEMTLGRVTMHISPQPKNGPGYFAIVGTLTTFFHLETFEYIDTMHSPLERLDISLGIGMAAQLQFSFCEGRFWHLYFRDLVERRDMRVMSFYECVHLAFGENDKVFVMEVEKYRACINLLELTYCETEQKDGFRVFVGGSTGKTVGFHCSP